MKFVYILWKMCYKSNIHGKRNNLCLIRKVKIRIRKFVEGRVNECNSANNNFHLEKAFYIIQIAEIKIDPEIKTFLKECFVIIFIHLMTFFIPSASPDGNNFLAFSPNLAAFSFSPCCKNFSANLKHLRASSRFDSIAIFTNFS